MSHDKPSSLIIQYTNWLKSQATELDTGKGWTELALPFLDRHNDFLVVYVRVHSKGFVIWDDRETFLDLLHSGFDLDDKASHMVVETILRGLGFPNPDAMIGMRSVIAKGKEMSEFPESLHRVFMAMLAIDGLANAGKAVME